MSDKNQSVISSGILIEKQVYKTPSIPKKPTKKCTFELSLELHKKLKKTAVEKDMTMLEIVEEALEKYLKD